MQRLSRVVVLTCVLMKRIRKEFHAASPSWPISMTAKHGPRELDVLSGRLMSRLAPLLCSLSTNLIKKEKQ